jgi:site-specific DNA recombinase
MWCGGRPPLGYDVIDKKLVINRDEAERVRGIFRIYLEQGSLLATCRELDRRQWRNKVWKNEPRGHVIDKTLLHRMLTNPIYIGKVTYRDEVHDGQHEAIIDQETWDAVQARLRDKGRDHDPARNKWGVLLRGLVKCGVCGASMVHHYASKGAKRYSYYVCDTQQKRGAAACPGSRISTRELEEFVIERIKEIGKDPALVRETIEAAKRDQESKKPELIAELRRLDQHKRTLAAERANLITAIGQGGAGTPTLVQRLGEIDEALAKAAQRAEELRQQLVLIETSVVDEGDLRGALAGFDEIWAELFPREQARILSLLVDTVTFNGTQNEVAITFRPGGIKVLASESARRSA